jgi:hypothetical protein
MYDDERKVSWEKLPKELQLKFAQKLTQYFDLDRKAEVLIDQLATALDRDVEEIRDILDEWRGVETINPAEVYEELR